MNGPFLTARKIWPLLDLLAKCKRVLACSCSPNFFVACKLAKQIFYFCSCSQKNRSARHARECSQRPFVTPHTHYHTFSYLKTQEKIKKKYKKYKAKAQQINSIGQPSTLEWTELCLNIFATWLVISYSLKLNVACSCHCQFLSTMSKLIYSYRWLALHWRKQPQGTTY